MKRHLQNFTERLKEYRSATFLTRPGSRIQTIEEAVNLINQRGFIYFWPIKGVTLPSLWVAVAGDRPVADEHDDPGHITWNWKDNLLGKRRVYYGRLLRRKNMFISLAMLPNFYALSPNFGDWEQDYLEQYLQGQMTASARSVYEALLHEGPLNTIALRKASHLSGSTAQGLFSRALDDLMLEMKILPVAVSDAGAWHYCHIYDIVPRHFPELQENSRGIPDDFARQEILNSYLLSVGASTLHEMQHLLGWKAEIIQRTLQKLQSDGKVNLQEENLINKEQVWLIPDLS